MWAKRRRQEDSRKGCHGEIAPQPGEEEVASPQGQPGASGTKPGLPSSVFSRISQGAPENAPGLASTAGRSQIVLWGDPEVPWCLDLGGGWSRVCRDPERGV